MSDCLHCDIRELIDERITNGPKPVDLAEIAAMVAQAPWRVHSDRAPLMSRPT